MHYVNETFFNRLVRNQEASLAQVRFEACRFDACVVSVPAKSSQLARFGNATFERCIFTGGRVTGAAVENVRIVDCQFNMMSSVTGSVFRHVYLEGNITNLLVNGKLPSNWQNEPLASALAAEWEAVDWSFDITSLDTADVTFFNVPLRTLRIDPEIQAIASLSQARDGTWRDAGLEGTIFEFKYRDMLRNNDPETLLQAPRSGKESNRLHDALRRLRSLGAAT